MVEDYGPSKSGLASTFVTKLDMPDLSSTPSKGGGCVAKTEKDSDDTTQLTNQSPNVKCLRSTTLIVVRKATLHHIVLKRKMKKKKRWT
jgi:hypothetical protein